MLKVHGLYKMRLACSPDERAKAVELDAQPPSGSIAPLSKRLRRRDLLMLRAGSLGSDADLVLDRGEAAQYITDQSVSKVCQQGFPVHAPHRLPLYPGTPARPSHGVRRISLVAVVFALTACAKKETVPEPVRAVRTMTVSAASVAASQEFAAEVRARTETRLGFRVGGRLTQRAAEIGQRVRAGQLLAQIDATDLKLSQESARSGVQAAQANVELAAAELKRYQELRQQGFISALELERRETALQAQRSQLSQAQAQLSVQGNQAGYANLQATASGVVTAVEAEVGAVLAAGAPVIRLAHDGARDAVFSVPEDVVTGVRQLIAVPGALRVKAWAKPEMYSATVREVAAAADPITRTFLVKAELGPADLQLGQTLTVRIEQPARGGVVRLPLSAVMQHRGVSAVWLLDRNTLTVRTQTVVLAGADGNEVVVAQGLAPGQEVVTAGVHTLTAGQTVRLYQEAPAPRASSATSAAPATAAPPLAAASR